MLEVWDNNKREDGALIKWVLEKVNKSDLSAAQVDIFTEKIRIFLNHVKKYLPQCNRMLQRFKARHARWLSQSITLTLDENVTDLASSSAMGRPKLNYSDAGERLKRKLACDLASDNILSTPHLLHAASVSAKKAKQDELATVLKVVRHKDCSELIKKTLFPKSHLLLRKKHWLFYWKMD